MNLAINAMIKQTNRAVAELEARVADLESSLRELQARRGPGRPPKSDQEAA